MKRRLSGYWVMGLLGCAVIWLSGCSLTKEAFREITGVSTKTLEDKRSQAIVKEFNCDYQVCYNQAINALKKINAYVYAQDKAKNMVAIYVNETDTTPVGLFFSSPRPGKTKIEVSSPSSSAKELISGEVFEQIDKELKIKKVDVQLNSIEPLKSK
jgi:hypothetical protein